MAERNTIPRHGTPLSDREAKVLQLVADGLSSGQIATRLFLSEHTVKSHVRRALARLGARNRTHAVAMLLAPRGVAVTPATEHTSAGLVAIAEAPPLRHEPVSPAEAARRLIRDVAAVS